MRIVQACEPSNFLEAAVVEKFKIEVWRGTGGKVGW
jgi:hypothetical protein